MEPIARREFVAGISSLGIANWAFARQEQPLQAASRVQAAPHAGFPRQPLEMVRGVVGAAHRDLEKVKMLVDAHPALANAAWDWGFGDWETPLGAAAHTGRRAIAEYLLSKGARPDVFCTAMMGHLEVLKAQLSMNPALAGTLGPHGITLLAHARAGDDAAAEVARFLEMHGGADNVQSSLPLSREQCLQYLGRYQIRDESPAAFEILQRQEQLTFKPSEGTECLLFRTADHEFHPAGVRAVRLRFSLTGDRVSAVTIHDGETSLIADRV